MTPAQLLAVNFSARLNLLERSIREVDPHFGYIQRQRIAGDFAGMRAEVEKLRVLNAEIANTPGNNPELANGGAVSGAAIGLVGERSSACVHPIGELQERRDAQMACAVVDELVHGANAGSTQSEEDVKFRAALKLHKERIAEWRVETTPPVQTEAEHRGMVMGLHCSQEAGKFAVVTDEVEPWWKSWWKPW